MKLVVKYTISNNRTKLKATTDLLTSSTKSQRTLLKEAALERVNTLIIYASDYFRDC